MSDWDDDYGSSDDYSGSSFSKHDSEYAELDRIERLTKGIDVSTKTSAKQSLLADRDLGGSGALSKDAQAESNAGWKANKAALNAVSVTSDEDKLKAAQRILSKSQQGTKRFQRAADVIEQIKRNQAAANPLRPDGRMSSVEFQYVHGASPVNLTTGGDASHGKLTVKRSNGYTSKAPAGAMLKGVQFNMPDFRQNLEKQIRREVDLRTVISSAYFNGEFKPGSGKSIIAAGKSQLFEKAMRAVEVHKKMYVSYLAGLGGVLETPEMPMSGNGKFTVSSGMHSGDKDYKALVKTNWKPLSDITLKRKQKEGRSLTFWKNSGRLASEYKRSLAVHMSKLKGDDSEFYDTKKLHQTMDAFRSHPDNRERRSSVTYTLELAIPKWQASNGALMDDLISTPFILGGQLQKVSHHFMGGSKFAGKVSKKILEARKAYREKHTTDDPRHNPRRTASAVLEERLPQNGRSGVRGAAANTHTAAHAEADKQFNSENKPYTMTDARNAFYTLNRVGSGHDRGTRRFINPEFRRPFVAELSSAAGRTARQALIALIEKGHAKA